GRLLGRARVPPARRRDARVVARLPLGLRRARADAPRAARRRAQRRVAVRRAQGRLPPRRRPALGARGQGRALRHGLVLAAAVGPAMSQSRLLGQRRFGPLFWTQFLGAFNDNVYKNALVILFTARLSRETAHTLVQLAGGIFILPYFLFS